MSPRLPRVSSLVPDLGAAVLEWHAISPTFSCTRSIGDTLTCVTIFLIGIYGHTGFNGMILRTVPVSGGHFGFSESDPGAMGVI